MFMRLSLLILIIASVITASDLCIDVECTTGTQEIILGQWVPVENVSPTLPQCFSGTLGTNATQSLIVVIEPLDTPPYPEPTIGAGAYNSDKEILGCAVPYENSVCASLSALGESGNLTVVVGSFVDANALPMSVKLFVNVTDGPCSQFVTPDTGYEPVPESSNSNSYWSWFILFAVALVIVAIIVCVIVAFVVIKKRNASNVISY